MSAPVHWFDLIRMLLDGKKPLGQKSAYAEFVSLNERCVGSFWAWRALEPDERESLVSDWVMDFVKLYREGRLIEESLPGLWKKHAQWRCVSYLRRKRREPGAGEPPDQPDPSPGLEEVIDGEDARWAVRRAVDELDSKLREVIKLRFEERLARAEIATRMGLPVGRVRGLEVKALSELRTQGLPPPSASTSATSPRARHDAEPTRDSGAEPQTVGAAAPEALRPAPTTSAPRPGSWPMRSSSV